MKKIISTPSFREFCMAISPVVPLEIKVIPTQTNPLILLIVFVVISRIIYVKVKIKKIWKWSHVGFRTDNLTLKNISNYLLASSLFCVGFVVIQGSQHVRPISAQACIFSLLYCFTQEVVFRSYLMKASEEWFGDNAATIITVNVILFTAMHSFFGLNPLQYGLLATAGFGFSYIYYKIPNIWLVTFFHFSTNILALHLGMFHPY